jgi:hypothetical protein
MARELGRVSEEVAYHLRKAGRIGVYEHRLWAELAIQTDSIFLEERAVVVDRSTNEIVQLGPPPFKSDLPSADTRDVEQVVDQTGQMLDLAFDHGIRATRLFTTWGGPFKDEQAVADGRQRVAQLVGKHGHDFPTAA